MTIAKPAFLLAAAALGLAACDVRIGDRNGNAEGNATLDVSAPDNGSDGQFTLSTPGFNLSMDLPSSVGTRIRARDSDFIYPGARIGGVHVAAGDDREDAAHVRIDFSSGDNPDRLVAWYRDPARGSDVRIASTASDGDATVLSGTHEDDRFELRIAPRPGGGSLVRLVLTDADR
jgi:hypothetical protein